ncbi:hypothetical protein [Chlamydiifrater volucris]|uniref:hypothetical protein n=1 Tax=Chlamydiifrater volucris TaxID=2681470 RepID=UPI001BCAD9D2|nr:hypothetical protein [Chlamydiifrater volucris]
MSSSISRSSSPQSPAYIQSSTRSPDSLGNRIEKTFHTLQSLYLFSLDKKTSEELTAKYNLAVVDALSSQISSIRMETTKNCLQIAQAMISLNIHLESRLQSCQVLTNKELLDIKSTLKDLDESGSSSYSEATSSSEMRQKSLLEKFTVSSSKEGEKLASQEKRKATDSALQSSLPFKKRKHFFEEASSALPSLQFPSIPPLTPSTPLPQTRVLQKPTSHPCSVILHTSNISEEIPLESMIAFVDMVASRKGWGPSDFSCHNHLGSSCPTCRPIQHLMILNKTQKEIFLRRQITDLLSYTTKQSLAKCLASNPILSESIRNAHYLRNYQIALVIKECGIGNEVCLPKVSNPATQLSVYLPLLSLIREGSNSTFVKCIKEIWLQTKNKGYPPVLRIAEDSPQSARFIYLEDFAKHFPDIQRSYPAVNRRRGIPAFSDKHMTNSFAKFLACVTFGTVNAILANPQYHHLLTPMPSGAKLPSMDLIMRVCCLALCSNTKYKVRILPCKISVKTRDYLHFGEETTKELFQSLLEFTVSNNIKLNGC